MLEVRWEFTKGNRELVENSPEVCLEVRREFADRLLGARRSSPENARSSLGVRRRKSGARRGFIGKMPGVRRRDDRTTNIIC
ncbi:hypothetical protein BHE74_00059881 [Ensete ventricosum]|nr:hypothetical protein BHE74_00059881 [Ensete ventricosum]